MADATRGDVLVDHRREVHVEDVVGAADRERARTERLDVGRHPQQQVAVAVGEAALGRGPGAGLRDDAAEAAAVAVQAPRATAGEVVVDRGHLVLQRHPHVGEVGVHQPREGEVDQPVHPAVRQRGLGPLARQHVHPGPLAPGLHQGKHLTAS